MILEQFLGLWQNTNLMKQGRWRAKISKYLFLRTQIKTEGLCVFWILVLLKEFQVEHQASNHAKPLVSLENLVLYVPVIAKRIADIQQSALLLQSEVKQVEYTGCHTFFCLRGHLNKFLYL